MLACSCLFGDEQGKVGAFISIVNVVLNRTDMTEAVGVHFHKYKKSVLYFTFSI